jgi:hypothetical protein
MVELTDTFANTGFGVFKKIVGEEARSRRSFSKAGRSPEKTWTTPWTQPGHGLRRPHMDAERPGQARIAHLEFLSEQETSGIIGSLAFGTEMSSSSWPTARASQ